MCKLAAGSYYCRLQPGMLVCAMRPWWSVLSHKLLCPSAGPNSRRSATCQEQAFLVGKGAVTKHVHKLTLVTVKAAYKALQHCGAPASTLAAVQGLQGAEPMMLEEQASLQV